VAVAVIGLGVVVCEGWPSMGSDFGGVVALTPGVLWMLLVLSGLRVTWGRLAVIGVGAAAAIALISWLDWRRGPGGRSHLGNFVQRVLDGDAVDIVSRKAVASVDTIVTPIGVSGILVGIVLWVLIFRRLLPLLRPRFATLRTVAVAALATAVLGTLLNDGGVYVWITITGAFAATVVSMALDGVADGEPAFAAVPDSAPDAAARGPRSGASPREAGNGQRPSGRARTGSVVARGGHSRERGPDS
jgi:hypothetical protein